MNKKIITKVVILAAGKGERMKSEIPKVLLNVKGKSMLYRLAEAVKASGIDDSPVIIVGYKKELVIAELGNGYEYIEQANQFGTGHAVNSARELLKGGAENIVVLYGDHPLVSPGTIKKLVDKHLASRGKLTMAIARLPDFEDWRAFFYASFSRIVRDENGEIIKDIQFRDANNEEKKITEVNPCYFCFDARWLWEKLATLTNNNSQQQYYLPDLVMSAIQEGLNIESININPQEALGANSREELAILERFMV